MGELLVNLNVNAGDRSSPFDWHALTWYGTTPTGWQAGCRCGWTTRKQVGLVAAVVAHAEHKVACIEEAEVDDPACYHPAGWSR